MDFVNRKKNPLAHWPKMPLLLAAVLFGAGLWMFLGSSRQKLDTPLVKISPVSSCPIAPCPPTGLLPIPEAGESLFLKNHIVAFYGHPDDARLGILGEYSPEELVPLLQKKAAEYNARNGEKGVVPAFHLIFGIVHPGGAIALLKEETVLHYIRVAKEHGMLVFLDHQIGRFSVESALKELLPYAAYDNVHFVIDPEWHTQFPGSKIGSVSAADVNHAEVLIQNYLEEKRIGGRKIFVVHQFNASMITSRPDVHADFSHVDLVHDMDGFGRIPVKKGSYASNALAKNIPLKGIKLFFPTTRRAWGYDVPLMTPAEVLALEPQPALVIYQ